VSTEGPDLDPEDDFDVLYDPEVQAALDGWEPPTYLTERPLPSRLTAWSRSTVLGAVVTGFAFGLREVYEPRQDDAIVIEVDADGEPHDLPIRLMLDPDSPAGSLCIVRRDPPPPVV
jgi:hypothetical protein